MKATVLVDNIGWPGIQGEWGLSIFMGNCARKPGDLSPGGSALQSRLDHDMWL